jgi:hypothetical protein
VTESDEERIARLKAELDDLERRYAEAEATKSGRSAATARRGPISLIAVLLGVSLAVGTVAAIDLRRLQSPTGAALAWTGAAVFGNCTAYRELSLATPPDTASAQEQCDALRARTEPAREQGDDVQIEVLEIEEDGETAEALVRVGRPEEPVVDVRMPLQRVDEGWLVLLTDEVCAAIGCA